MIKDPSRNKGIFEQEGEGRRGGMTREGERESEYGGWRCERRGRTNRTNEVTETKWM